MFSSSDGWLAPLSEANILRDENASKSEVAALQPAESYTRSRSWPHEECRLLYAPDSGFVAFDCD